MVFDVAILNNFDKSAPPVKRGSPNGVGGGQVRLAWEVKVLLDFLQLGCSLRGDSFNKSQFHWK